MGVWDAYNSRIGAYGSSRREMSINKLRGLYAGKIPDSAVYESVLVDGEPMNVAIIDSDNLNQKSILTLPGGQLYAGQLVDFADNKWLISEMNARNEIYAKGIMIQCNYLLRWINDSGEIVERWSIVSDGTKYLTGETLNSYDDNGMILGDTRISLMLARDSETIKINRQSRFLIDDYGSPNVLAYRVTKPFKIGGVYNGHGAMTFVLTEVNAEDSDNFELHIANYYKYFPRETENDTRSTGIGTGETKVTQNGKKVWL
jgi:hypothetical protein